MGVELLVQCNDFCMQEIAQFELLLLYLEGLLLSF